MKISIERCSTQKCIAFCFLTISRIILIRAIFSILSSQLRKCINLAQKKRTTQQHTLSITNQLSCKHHFTSYNFRHLPFASCVSHAYNLQMFDFIYKQIQFCCFGCVVVDFRCDMKRWFEVAYSIANICKYLCASYAMLRKNQATLHSTHSILLRMHRKKEQNRPINRLAIEYDCKYFGSISTFVAWQWELYRKETQIKFILLTWLFLSWNAHFNLRSRWKCEVKLARGISSTFQQINRFVFDTIGIETGGIFVQSQK